MSVSEDTRNRQLIQVFSSFEAFDSPRTSDDFAPLIEALSGTSSDLASSKHLRILIGTAKPSVWPSLRQLWSGASRLVERLDDDETTAAIEAQAVHSWLLNLGKFTRNLVAEVRDNQTQAFASCPEICRIIVYYTSWTRENEDTSHPATRMLTQTLSNIVTGNNELQDQFWSSHVVVPVEQSILIRLIASQDPRTLLSTMVLILNCICFSQERARALSTTATGARICVAILDWMETHVDSADIDKGPAPSDEQGKVFELGYSIFTSLFEQGMFGELYRRISVQEEAVAPPQITLLKLLDSYFHSQSSLPLEASTIIKLSEQLSSLFLSLSGYTQQSVRRAVGSAEDRETAGEARDDPPPSPAEQESGGEMRSLDLQLPSVCKALVLVSQCLVTMLLLAEEGKDQSQGDSTGRADDTGRNSLKAVVLESRASEEGRAGRGGFVEELTETLRLLDLFLPRLNFGKAVPSKLSPTSPLNAPTQVDPTGFTYLKRDLVRLLGVLSHGNRAAQDRVRLCGGIPVVMNLCVIDDANPYLREHAIFALRNLLHNNPENQAVVDAIKPMATWSEDGVLRDR